MKVFNSQSIQLGLEFIILRGASIHENNVHIKWTIPAKECHTMQGHVTKMDSTSLIIMTNYNIHNGLRIFHTHPLLEVI
jgi:hypothetical protein